MVGTDLGVISNTTTGSIGYGHKPEKIPFFGM
jgi:hypothetical protein